jgi:hypothetical protein
VPLVDLAALIAPATNTHSQHCVRIGMPSNNASIFNNVKVRLNSREKFSFFVISHKIKRTVIK